jgi:predicted flap endonuclease-1-like 5' DNA nuclease
MAGGAANLAIALFGGEASNNLVVLPQEVNVHGLLDLGVGATGGTNPLEGLSAVLLVRDDPTMRLAGADAALSGMTVVAIDNVLSGAAKQASVVLAEGRAYASSGTYTQGDHRIQKLTAAVKPEGDAVSLFEALSVLGAELGVELPKTPDAALGEISKLDAAYQPAWDLIIGEGVRRSVPVSAKATAAPVEAVASGEGARVIASRDLYTALDAAALRHPEAEKLHRYDRIQVSEVDGARLGIATGDEITISAGGAAVAAKATVTERVPAGHVYLSSLAQGGAVSRFFVNGHVPAVTLARGGGSPVPATPAPVAAPATVLSAPPEVVEPGRIPVEAITGVDDAAKTILNDAGIVWLDEFLEVAGPVDGRKALATQTGIDARQLLEWANRADLMRISGVTAALADLLENSGVDTVRELAQRNAANLYQKLLETAGGQAPSAEAVTSWIATAKTLPAAITH